MAGATKVSNEAELSVAIQAGGKVQLTKDISISAPVELKADVILDGNGYTIDGGGTTHFIQGEAFHLWVQNVTIENMYNGLTGIHFGRQSGAEIMLSGYENPSAASLTIVNSVFRNNKTKPNTPDGDIRGGAVYAFWVPDVQIYNTIFDGNQGTSGGGLGGLGSSMDIFKVTFSNNKTIDSGEGWLDGAGGAISLDALSQNGVKSHLHVCGVKFENNSARQLGGAFYLVAHANTGGDEVFEQVEVTNSVSTDGVVIYWQADDNGSAGSLLGSGPNSTTIKNVSIDGKKIQDMINVQNISPTHIK